jgi:SHS2 domain-containing protein
VRERGHRFVPHTADIRIEAWAPTREGCLVEAVTALTASFADLAGARPELEVTTEFPASSDVEALVSVLDEVIYLLDTRNAVPVKVEVTTRQRTEPAPVVCRFWLAPIERVALTGSIPKAVTLHQIHFGPGRDHWSCAVTIDV